MVLGTSYALPSVLGGLSTLFGGGGAFGGCLPPFSKMSPPSLGRREGDGGRFG